MLRNEGTFKKMACVLNSYSASNLDNPTLMILFYSGLFPNISKIDVCYLARFLFLDIVGNV